jgi:hypothetical protein
MRRDNRGGALKVILIILGVIVFCVALGAIYVATHWKTWVVNVANVATEQMIKESGLPDDQREEILSEVHQFGDDFKSGKVSREQLQEVARAITDGPLIPLAGVQVARHKYIDPSTMSEKEKAESVRSVQRFARGIYEKRILKADVDDVVKPIADLRPNGRWKLKDNPTTMEISQFVANAKARADAAMIPNEPFDLNIAEELKKAIHGS